MTKSRIPVSRMALLVGAAMGIATGAAAQTVGAGQQASAGDEEIIVTATRRSESIQDVPFSISALTGQQLIESGALQSQDVARLVPGLAYTEVNSGQAVLAVRGVQTSAVFGNVQQPVALYYDDVPVLDLVIPWTVPKLQLFDVDRVEVLRGPQGTLFGAGALSGAIRVIHTRPDLSNFDAATEASVIGVDGGGIGGTANLMVNVPIVSDELAMRAVVYYDERPGWIDNPTRGDDDVNRGLSRGGRVALTWRPTEAFEVTGAIAKAIGRPHDSAYVVYGSNSDTSNHRLRTYNNDDTTIYNVSASYTMPWATLTSSTSYITRDATSQIDFTDVGTFYSDFYFGTALTAVSPLTDQFSNSNLLQEIRLASNGDGPFSWVVGVFGEQYRFDLHEEITQEGVSGLGYPTDHWEDIRIRTDIDDYAVFAEGSYAFAPELTFTAGLRYSHYSIKTHEDVAISGETFFDGPPGVVDREASHDALTPKFSLAYEPNDDVMVYASASRGFRTGNTNLAAPINPFDGSPVPQSYEPDSLWNYEIGAKLSLLDRRLTVDAAAFYIDWSDIQLQVRGAGGIPYTDNAGSATSQGVELQIVARPATGWEAGTSLTFADATLETVNPGVPGAQPGDQLPGSAPFTGYVYGQYSFPIFDDADMLLRMDYAYTGRAYTDLGNSANPAALRYGDYGELGARATARMGDYELGVFATNLTNNDGRSYARTYFFVNEEIRQTPRTIGVMFRAKL